MKYLMRFQHKTGLRNLEGFVNLLLPAILAWAMGCSQKEPEAPHQPDTAMLTRFVQTLADSLHAHISVAAYDLETAWTFGFNDRELMHAASTMKVPVMIKIFRQAEQGRFSIDDSITIKNEFRSIVDGSMYSLSPQDDGEQALYQQIGTSVPIRTLVEKMITWSSNLATNLLIELVDARAVTATMRDLGAPDIQVLRGVEDIKAYRKGLSNRTTAFDMMVILRALADGKAASAAACDEMIAILKQQHFRERIPAGVPDGVPVANKTGMITAIDHDCAIVFPPGRRPYILVVLTKGIADTNQSGRAIAAISAKFYQEIVERAIQGS